MVGESFFKIFSLGILSLIFISIVASADKEPKKAIADDLSVIFSHINLAAQANAFNKDHKHIPPEAVEDTSEKEKTRPAARQ